MSKVTLDDKRLKELIATARPKVERVVKTMAFKVERSAKVLAPVDTGAMRNSINAQPVDDRGESAVAWWVLSPQEYSGYVEFGTSRMRAQPFLVPALEGHRGEFEQRIAELFK